MAERNPSKQKRAAQNKAARQALAARRARAAAEPRPAPAPKAAAPAEEAQQEAAAPRRRFRMRPEPTETGRPSRTAPGRPSRVAATKGGGSSSASSSTATGRPGRPPRPVGPGPDRPEHPGWRGFLAHLQQIPGGKAVLFAFIFSLVAAVMVLVTADSLLREPAEGAQQVIEEVLREQGRAITPDDSGGFEPILLALVALPVIVSGVVLEGTRRPNRRRLFMIGAIVLGAFVLFVGAVGVYFYFSMGGLFFAAYQARKADPPVRPNRARDQDDDEDEDDFEDDVDEDLDEDDERA